MYHQPLLASPSYHPPPIRLYQPPTPISVPSHHHSSYAPRTPIMDPNLYTGPPSPDDFSPSTPAVSAPHSYQPSMASTSIIPPPRPYMSTSLVNQFESLNTASPTLISSSGPGSQRPDDQQHHQQPQQLTILKFGPNEGTQGTQVTIKCDVNFPPTPPPRQHHDGTPDPPKDDGRALRMVFGTHPVQTSVAVLTSPGVSSEGQICQLTATVPSWSSTGAVSIGRSNRIPVYVQVLDGAHALVESVLSGEFTYMSMGPKGFAYNNYMPGMASNPLKRGGENLEANRPSPGHASLHRRVFSNSSRVDSPEMAQYAQMPQQYQPSPTQGPDPSVYSSPYMNTTPTLPSSQTVGGSSFSPATQPSLMRSTQVSQPPGAPVPANPYVMSGPSKACLELTGDIDLMAKSWTQDEWLNRRRLVQFWRRQENTTIYAAFRPLAQQDYPQAQQSIIISCIFREDRNECFVTSVDAIYLLEALVGTRFTVEEKNRIRRNLEGFRPITVSKNKPGSEEFFKLIMGFPNPKPRNIEKDVKVFPWEILGQALKKIIGKYSATYPIGGNSNMPTIMAPQLTPQPTPVTYTQPLLPGPLPVQDHYGNPSVIDSGSAPTLVSHSSSDSSNYNVGGEAIAYGQGSIPDTPQMSHGQHISGSPTHYRSLSSNQQQHQTTPTAAEKYHQTASDYVNFSPNNDGQYSQNATGQYWGPSDPALNSPTITTASYATLPGQGVGYDQPHQLPHVHETHSRQPSSNDLRVMYPNLGQQQQQQPPQPPPHQQ